MNPISVDIKDMLEAESSLGLTFNANLFIGRVPARPAEVVVIFDSYGYPPDLGVSTVGYERPSAQIIVRTKDYLRGMTLAEDIKDSLHGRNHETWGGTLYTVIACLGNPTPLEWDENGLVQFSINFNAQRRVV